MIRTLALTLAICAVAASAQAQTEAPAAAPAPAADPAQRPAQPVLPTASAIRSGGDMLLIPGRELVVAWTIGQPPTQVSEAAAPPHGLPPIPSDPKLETWGKPIAVEHMKAGQPGQVVFSLWVEEGRGTTLAAASGQDKPFFYMANLIVRHEGRLMVSPTTICAVRPGRIGIETWPYPVEAIQIVGMGLIPEDMCYDHTAKKGYKAGEQPPSMIRQN